MKTLTAILVDDEISALKGLRSKVEKLFPHLNILETFQQPEKAIEFIKNSPPDILFLDIQMPRINGFELLEQLDSISFQIIFVTAYSEYAIQAFKESAVDYILKPVDNNELSNAVEKAIERIESSEEGKSHQELIEIMRETMEKSQKLVVPTSKGLSFIPQREVYHLEGYEGYTKIHLVSNTEILSSYSLGKFEKMLGKLFFKCHKSHIVNLELVRSFENEGYIVLENGSRVPISKTHRKTFLDLFN
ncbi:MAG: response regulator transcription factor [Flavobacteriaceae bacterium]|nr:response regulator transcription factor [Flavobacteriaceae bacterium]